MALKGCREAVEEEAMRTMADRGTVPMSRTASLGELLSASRRDAGLGLDEIGLASGLPAARIAAVEAGRHDLSDAELSDLLERYPIPSPPHRPHWRIVQIDLDGGCLRMDRSRRPRSVPAADRNLLRYLELVHHRFAIEPGVAIPLKAVDLVLLRSCLALRRDEVTSRLDRMTGSLGPDLVRHRSLWAAAFGTGLAVAAGAVVLIPPDRPGDDGPSGVDPRIDIGTPMVVEREPVEAPTPSLQVPAGTDPDPHPDPHPDPDPDRSAPAPAPDPRGASVDTASGPADPGPVVVGPDPVVVPTPITIGADNGSPLVPRRPAGASRPPSPDPPDGRSRGPPGPAE
jgi:hypothetical protein